MKWIIIEKYADMPVRDYLLHIAQFSKRLLIKAKSEEGKILVNGEKKTVRHRLHIGDKLEVQLPIEPRGIRMVPEKMELQHIYEDPYILVLDKEAKIATIPSRNHPTGTLANGILYYYQQNNIPSTVHTVTRLDRDTSGLVLIAKHPYSHSLFSNLQRGNAIHRKYTAIVSGQLPQKVGTIDQPIGRKKDSIIERAVVSSGQKAISHYSVKKACSSMTLVEVKLETGRTHQIRVHFSFIGHPLLGDELYGGDTRAITRQALHCSELAFRHPFTKNQMLFRSPLPKDLKAVFSAKD